MTWDSDRPKRRAAISAEARARGERWPDILGDLVLNGEDAPPLDPKPSLRERVAAFRRALGV